MLEEARKKTAAWKELTPLQIKSIAWISTAMKNSRERLFGIVERVEDLYDLVELNTVYQDMLNSVSTNDLILWNILFEKMLAILSSPTGPASRSADGGLMRLLESICSVLIEECQSIPTSLDGAGKRWRLLGRWLTLLSYVLSCNAGPSSTTKRRIESADNSSDMMKRVLQILEAQQTIQKTPAAKKKKKNDD